MSIQQFQFGCAVIITAIDLSLHVSIAGRLGCHYAFVRTL
jgi:hypothetical protein